MDRGGKTQIYPLLIFRGLLSVLPELYQDPLVWALSVSWWACFPRKPKNVKEKQNNAHFYMMMSLPRSSYERLKRAAIVFSWASGCPVPGGGKGAVGAVVGKRTWLSAIALQMVQKRRERVTSDSDTHKHHLLTILWASLCKAGSWLESGTWSQSGWAWVLCPVEETNHRLYLGWSIWDYKEPWFHLAVSFLGWTWMGSVSVGKPLKFGAVLHRILMVALYR